MPEMVLAQVGNVFPQMLQNLENMGFFLYLFPFLLSLAIFYGVMSAALQKQLEKSARALISIILAFFVMLYSSFNPTLVSFFASLSGVGLILASGLLFGAIIFGLAGFDLKRLFMDKDEKKLNWASILIIVFVLVLVFFGAGAGSLIPLPSWSGSSEMWTAIFFIAIVALALWWMTKGEEK
jgi:hypothetical protein